MKLKLTHIHNHKNFTWAALTSTQKFFPVYILKVPTDGLYHSESDFQSILFLH